MAGLLKKNPTPYSYSSPVHYVVHILLLMAIAFLVYYKALWGPFVFDDKFYVVENQGIRSLQNFLDIRGSRYVTFFTFALNYLFGGLSPFGYHLVNVFIHITNSFLVYVLVIFTFRTPWMGKGRINGVTARDIAFVSSLIFLVHPIQTQAVSYITQRFTSLCTLFYLLSLILYVRWRLASLEGRNSMGVYLLSLLSAVVCQKTKEIGFTLPFMVFMYETIFFGEWRKMRRYLLPFALVLVIVPMEVLFMWLWGTGMSDEHKIRDLATLSPWRYLITQFYVIVRYMRLILLPVGQNVDYGWDMYHSPFEPGVVVPFLFLLFLYGGVGYLFFVSRRNCNGYGVLVSWGMVWFLVTLLVESSIIPIRDVIFEHRVYLPMAGMIPGMVTGMYWLLERALHPWRGYIRWLMVLFLAVPLGAGTYIRNGVWADEVALWEDSVSKSPWNARAHNNLGLAYEGMGRMEEAKREYMEAIRIDPSYAEAHNNLGLIYEAEGRIEDAMREFKKAVELKPRLAEAHNNLGNIYLNLGRIDDALREYMETIRLKPHFAEAYNNLGLVYERLGLPERAMEEYRKALVYKPDYIIARYHLANVYTRLGLLDRAMEEYRAVIRAKPDLAEAYNNLGVVYARKGLMDYAIENFTIAIRLRDDYFDAYNNLGRAYYSKGEIDLAIDALSEAVRLNPASADARYNLSLSYLKKGDRVRALDEARRLLELYPDHRKAQRLIKELQD